MEEAPSRAQWFVKTNDIITSTVRPIRRLSALIESEQNNYICSSGFEISKTGVERAIESDEVSATAWINQQLEALGINLSNSN